MSRTMRARFGSARLLLAGFDDGSPRHRVQSQAQHDIIVAELRSAALTPVEKQELTTLSTQIAWAEGHGEQIRQLLSPMCRETRSSMQNYESIVEFFTEREWELLLSTEVTTFAQRELILSRAVKLGVLMPVRNKSEEIHSPVPLG